MKFSDLFIIYLNIFSENLKVNCFSLEVLISILLLLVFFGLCGLDEKNLRFFLEFSSCLLWYVIEMN